jgi:hypothetical protein
MPDEPLTDEKKKIGQKEAVKYILEDVKPPEKQPLKDLPEKQHAKDTETKKSLLEDCEESVETDCSFIEVTGPLLEMKQQEAEVEVDNSYVEAIEPLSQEKQLLEVKSSLPEATEPLSQEKQIFEVKSSLLEATEHLSQEKQILEIKTSLSEAAEPLAMEKTDQKNFSEEGNNSNLEQSELLVSSLDSFEGSSKTGSIERINQCQENDLLSISGGTSCFQKPTSNKLPHHVLLPKFQPSPADVSAIATFEKHSHVASDRLLHTLLETDDSGEQLMLSDICKRCLPPATRLQNDEDLQSRLLVSECKTQKRHSWLWSSPEVRKRQARHDAVEREACDDVEERQPMIGKSVEQSGSEERRVVEDPDDIRGMVFIRPPDSEEDALRIQGQNVSAEPVSETRLCSANSAEPVSATQLYSANSAELASATQIYSTISAEPVRASQLYSVSATQLHYTNSADPVSATQLYFTNSAEPVSSTQLYSANSAESVSSTSPRSLSRHVSFRTPQVAAHKMFK